MSLNLILIVLFAAILHATWNFLVKRSDDKLLSMSAVVIGHVPKALIHLHDELKQDDKVQLELTPYDLTKGRIVGIVSD